MPTLFIITAISESYPDSTVNPDKYFLKKKFLYSSGFFRLPRRFTPRNDGFMGHFLAAAAILTRE